LRSTSLPQNEGHFTYNCAEIGVLGFACVAIFWCGSGSGSSQHALSLQMLTCCCKQLLFTGFWPYGAVHASVEMHSRLHS
jgi:hypothetical protein